MYTIPLLEHTLLFYYITVKTISRRASYYHKKNAINVIKSLELKESFEVNRF